MTSPIRLVALLALAVPAAPEAAADGPAAVLGNYADIALAMYGDALASAEQLDQAIAALLRSPDETTLAAAREAWLAARVPYQQTEVYRFGNPLVDEWEGKVNAWPLDEGLIDYVQVESYGDGSDENAFYVANVVANPKLTVGGRDIDAGTIGPDLLGDLHEADEVEANVSRGYHAIEFLLWGQDLNGTGPGKGERPATDYAKGDACTGGNCDRRGAYLAAASRLLLTDLREMMGNWAANGPARAALTAEGARKGLSMMLTGLGSLSYGELAGERIKLGLMLHDPEEEHDCFSDNTHNSHFYDVAGMRAVYLGRYEGTGGKVAEGASLSDLVRAADPAVDDGMRAALDRTLAAFAAIKQSADSGQMAYDQMLAEDNEQGNAMIQAAVDALVAQTREIEKAVAALGLDQLAFEGSDSLDNPEAVFQ
ncbi:MAG: imelysin family protein [Geminicoccaceae bacterium]